MMLACVAAGTLAANAYDAKTESRAFFATNPDNSVGKPATITIDGKFDDWNESMIIARNGANNISTAYKGSHENNVLDIYAVYAAWDDTNLYIAWQMCNTGDVWARPGDGPLTDYGKPGNIPLIVALSVDPSTKGMTGRLADGGCIWVDGKSSGTTFDPESVHVDHMLFMSAQPGDGVPAIFTGDASGASNYGANCHLFSASGVTYKRGDGFLPSELWRCRSTADWSSPTDLISDPSVINDIYDADKYDNILGNTVAGLQPHDTAYDTFYEIQIPFKALGITREWLEANGIGCRVIGTRGESALDCCPFDPSMIDNTFEEYGADASTTHEKDDLDVITYAMADIAKIRDLSNIEPLPTPDEPDPVPTPGPDEPAGEYNVYLKDGYPTSYAYLWDAGNGNLTFAGAWPGSVMSPVTVNGVAYQKYSFNLESAPITPMVIFNNGSGGTGNQTNDFAFVNNGIYTLSGFTGEYVQITSGVDEISAAEGEAEYFDLFGRRLPAAPEKGIFIKVQAGKALKIAR